MTTPAPDKSGKVQGHYVEDPASLLPGADDDYMEAFTAFLAKRYKSKPDPEWQNMARVLLSRRKDAAGIQRDYGDAGAQGVDDLVAFGKSFRPASPAPTALIRPFGAME